MYSFSMAFSPLIVLISAFGAVLGIIWGAMPGLSPAMALALLLGLTYSLGTTYAIAFLLSVLISATFGGAISAILINIPGTPDSVPTQWAGHPLAKKGQGGLALGTAITSCMLGNWAGILLLIATVPLILEIALKFHSWEMALLFIWAVSICGTLSSDESPLKAWIAGWFGLLIALVGMEGIFGVERFTFGNPKLQQGISFLPVLMGLFGLTEIFVTLSEPSPYIIPEKVGRVLPPLRSIIKYWKSIIRSSLIGLYIGVLPAAGPTMAAYVSYGLGERFTKRKFSEGDLEGVICSEVAGNAEIGGALLPTLLLGIPGSGGTAIFLASVTLHGIITGPMIDFEQPGLLNFIYGSLILANFTMYFLAFVLIKPSVKLFSLPRELLLPIITIILVISSYVERFEIFDIYLMFGFGLLGFIMRKTGFPIAPMTVGVILGDMLDVNLRRAMVVFEKETIWQILSRPIGTILIIIVILTFISAMFRKKK